MSTEGVRAAGQLAEAMRGVGLTERLQRVADAVAGPIVFTTSFGIEDQAVTHALFMAKLRIDVVTIDTGRLFPETYEVWAETEARYRRRIRAVVPDRAALEALVASQGINGFRHSVEARQACCGLRKVEPLGRALAGAAAWVTGLRAEQSHERSATPLAAFDEQRGLIKVNPLADWSREDVRAFIAGNAVPYNPLHDRGFPSIGCAPCTRAVLPGEPERAGRWWWENEERKECGLHPRVLPPSVSKAVA